jgi:ligand-binding sensor domain-containing protein
MACVSADKAFFVGLEETITRPRLLKKHVIIFLLVSFAGEICRAQFDTLRFTKYTMKDGMSENSVNCVLQDEQGYIWAGTINGLNRFDGNEFSTYYQGQAPLNLPNNYIFFLKSFRDGKLGLVTRKGLQVLNVRTYKSTYCQLRDSSIFSIHQNAAFDALELNEGYAFTSKTGFYVFDLNGKLNVSHEVYNYKDIEARRVDYGQDIFQPNDTDLIIYNANSIDLYNTKTKTLKQLSRKDQKYDKLFPAENNWTIRKQLNRNEYFFLPFDKDSIFYYNHATGKKTGSSLPFQTSSELYWASYIFPYDDTTFIINGRFGGAYIFYLNRQTGKINFKPGKQLTEHRCNWFTRDKEGRWWIATDNGLLKQELEAPAIRSWFYYDGKLTSGNAYFDNVFIKDSLIFLTRFAREEGLFIIDSRSMKLIKKISFFKKDEEWNSIINIQSYYKDTLWISCIPGIIWFDLKTFRYGKLDLPPGVRNQSLLLGPPGENDEAWMCSFMRNLALRYDIKRRTFQLFNKTTKPAFRLAIPKHIFYDYKGDVWFAGHGMLRFNKKTNSFDSTNLPVQTNLKITFFLLILINTALYGYIPLTMDC